jgi:phage shock protein PspC (stress-responsive transcriptional regulator)
MTKQFQQDIQTLMPFIFNRLEQQGVHHHELLFISSPSDLRDLLAQTSIMQVIEGLADYYGLSPITCEFIMLHEWQLVMLNYPKVSLLPSLEACNDHNYLVNAAIPSER